jgi:steroid delta-isomerase-like uncharacterized protein
MSAEESKAVMRRFYEASGDVDRQIDLLGADYVDHSLPPGMPPGAEGFRHLAAGFGQAFPDLQVTVEHLVAEGELVASRVTVTGTHRGPLLGMPATGRRVTFTSTNISRVANGKIAEHWGNSDQLGLMQQLGAIPAPGAAGA